MGVFMKGYHYQTDNGKEIFILYDRETLSWRVAYNYEIIDKVLQSYDAAKKYVKAIGGKVGEE